jgi:O-antigen/teichoic acid export membrane protein
MLLPIFAFLFAFPGTALRLFFHSQPAYVQLTSELRVMVGCYTMFLAGQVCMHVLNGLEQGRATFFATLVGAIGNVAVVLPLTLRFGLTGALWAGLVPIAAQAAMAATLLWRRLSSLPETGANSECNPC